jgi:hypothetical protein
MAAGYWVGVTVMCVGLWTSGFSPLSGVLTDDNVSGNASKGTGTYSNPTFYPQFLL